MSHTADLEIVVEADTFEELVRGSIAAVTEEVTSGVDGENRISFSIRGDSEEELLMKALDEVVYRQDAENFYARGARVSREGKELRVEMTGGPADVKDEIKAVTWHEFRVRRTGDKWKAHFICDV